MDYLDRGKIVRHQIILYVGYALIAVAITIAALILLYQAYGFGVTKNGTVIQNGLTFFSSQPNPADIYVNGKLNSSRTNTRLVLPENIYRITLAREGYRDWKRTVNVQGGKVQHFDYPLLIPKQLAPKKLQTYGGAPGLSTQSPDLRWLLVQQPGSLTDFDMYDIKTTTKTMTSFSLPTALLTKPTATENLQFVEWADDNQHVLLQHTYDDKVEFILVDRTEPAQSVNLNTTLGVNPSKLTFNNRKYDQYYLYDSASGTLQMASLKADTAPTPRLQHVLAYKTYSDDTILYVTANDSTPGKASVKLLVGNKTYSIRSVPVSDNYVVDLTKYSGTMYVVAGSSSDDRVYIYRDPVGQLRALPNHAVVPAQVLHVEQPNYLSFSTNAQFIVAENGTHFGVYDIENKLGYNYVSPAPLDPPQQHASWMDGNRLVYSSGGKLQIADYDGANRQTLMAADPSYLSAFAPNYRAMYSLVPSASAGQFELTQTSLLAPTDQ